MTRVPKAIANDLIAHGIDPATVNYRDARHVASGEIAVYWQETIGVSPILLAVFRDEQWTLRKGADFLVDENGARIVFASAGEALCAA